MPRSLGQALAGSDPAWVAAGEAEMERWRRFGVVDSFIDAGAAEVPPIRTLAVCTDTNGKKKVRMVVDGSAEVPAVHYAPTQTGHGLPSVEAMLISYAWMATGGKIGFPPVAAAGGGRTCWCAFRRQ